MKYGKFFLTAENQKPTQLRKRILPRRRLENGIQPQGNQKTTFKTSSAVEIVIEIRKEIFYRKKVFFINPMIS